MKQTRPDRICLYTIMYVCIPVSLFCLCTQMASIEVSLAGSRRRSAGARDVSRELDALRTALTDKDTLIQRWLTLLYLYSVLHI